MDNPSSSPLKKLELPQPPITSSVSNPENRNQSPLSLPIVSPKNNATEVKRNATIGTIDLNEPWNMMMKRYLKRIGEQAECYHWAHEKEKVFYEQLDKKLRIANVIFVAVITTLNASNLMALLSKQSYTLILIVSSTLMVINIVQLVITGILELGNYQQLIFDHKWNAVKFSEIHSDILTQFSLPVDKREKDDDYMRNKTKEFSDTLTTNPPIRPSTFKEYEKATEQENIFKPIVIGGFDKIEIVIDSGESGGPINTSITCEEVKNNLHEKINLELDRFLNRTTKY